MLAISLILAAGVATAALPAEDPALVKQAARCSLHADLASSTEREPSRRKQWIAQKEALVLYASRAGEPKQVVGWINEFADEILAAKGKDYRKLVNASSQTCQRFLKEHGDRVKQVVMQSAAS